MTSRFQSRRRLAPYAARATYTIATIAILSFVFSCRNSAFAIAPARLCGGTFSSAFPLMLKIEQADPAILAGFATLICAALLTIVFERIRQGSL